jgi:hypothetical protein
MSVATTGTPIADASIGERGETFAVRREHVDVHSRVEAGDVVAAAEETHTRGGCPRPVAGIERVFLGGIVVADHRESQARNVIAQSARGVEDLRVSLLAHQATDEADDHVVGRGRTELGARGLGVGGGDRRAIETTEIDAVPEQRQLARGYADAPECRDIFGVLHELGVGAQPCDPFHSVDHGAPGEAVVGLRVEAVHGVDDDRHSSDPRRDPTVESGLRIVGVDDRGPQATEHRDQLAQRLRIFERGKRPGGVAERNVTDAALFERGHERSGRGDADHVVARGGERLELVAEQPVEGDVSGRHMDHPRSRCAHSDLLMRTSSRRGSRISRPIQCAPERVLERHAAGQLPLEELHAVADLDRRSRQALGIGAPRARRAVRVHPRSRERGGTEPVTHKLRGPRESRHGLRVGEVEARAAQPVGDQPARRSSSSAASAGEIRSRRA